jgi:16S rRNA (cytosine1402-N4)-methyltransferase
MKSENVKEHQSVLLAEVVKALNICADGVYIDATFGYGGHSRAILAQLNTKGRLLVVDKDPYAIEVANALMQSDPRVTVRQGSFTNLYAFCKEEDLIGKIDGIVLDLGVSSPQLDNQSRGFSFRLEGPLDMRMDPTTGISAADWLNKAKETEIAWVLKTYGEERFYKRIARAIVYARAKAPLTSTVQLAEIIAKAHPAWEKHKHPATRSFQAIRIFINNELDELLLVLEAALALLALNGRLVVVSFHSLEDRIVKRFIYKHEKGDEHPKGLPLLASQHHQSLRRVGRQIKPSLREIFENRRARSAVLRVAEKTAGDPV